MTKTRTFVVAALLTVLFVSTATSSLAQTNKMVMTPAEILGALKPGQWVKLEGTVQKDLSVLCTKIKFLTGDFLDDDWSLTGTVRKANPEKQELAIFHMPIKIQKDAEFQSDDGTFKSFAQVKVGMFLQVEGTYLKDGTFLAKELEDKSAKLAKDSGLENNIEAEGKVERVDAAKSAVTLMGMTFRINEKTKSRSVIK